MITFLVGRPPGSALVPPHQRILPRLQSRARKQAGSVIHQFPQRAAPLFDAIAQDLRRGADEQVAVRRKHRRGGKIFRTLQQN